MIIDDNVAGNGANDSVADPSPFFFLCCCVLTFFLRLALFMASCQWAGQHYPEEKGRSQECGRVGGL
jgi:hypothetical protein